MIREALDEKYSYQIDEHGMVHLFRGEEDCQQYLTNPLLSAIFKIEALKKENEDLKEQFEHYKAFESHCDEIEEDAKAIAKENEWHNIEDKHDLPWEEGVYEFRDKDGEIEEVCILWDDNDDCNIGWEYYDAWRNLTTKENEQNETIQNRIR